jgi:hypothetical protein
MTPRQFESLEGEFHSASRDAEVLTRPSRSLTRRPPSGGWSAAECLQHLNLTAVAMRALLEPVIARVIAKGARSDSPGRLGFMGWMLVKVLEPPARMKSTTTAPFVPGAIEQPERLGPVLVAENERFIELARRSVGFDLGPERVESPFRAGVFYSPYAALRIIAVHERRHLWQARQALNDTELQRGTGAGV